MTQYAAAAAFVRSLVARGVRHAVVSPGLRSVPIALTVEAMPGLEVTIAHDERVGGFTALGIAKATQRPVLVVCTSGSAVANLFPSVLEAFHARVPLIIATGDRPPELRGWDSPQTIDQIGIFGTFAATIEMPSPEAVDEKSAVDVADAAWRAAGGVPAGPIHVNWPFREPLEPPGPLALDPVEMRWSHDVEQDGVVDPELVGIVAAASSGLIAAGELTPDERAATRRLAAATGWPIVADPLSGLRTDSADPRVITTADHLLSVGSFGDTHVPEVVLRVGSAPTSKSLRLWMERIRPKRVVVVDPAGRRRDPSRTMTDLVEAPLESFASAVAAAHPDVDTAWSAPWAEAEHKARDIIRGVTDTGFEEAAATRITADAIGSDVVWHVASSTPIRDVDWYVHATAASITSNRGANGIDGTVATATGLGIGSNRPVVVTLGDVAAVHDVGGILATRRLERPPVVIVYGNGGGGIFSLLPIAGATEPAAFDRVLHTAVDVDLAAIAAASGLRHRLATDAPGFREAIGDGLAGQPSLIEARVTVEGSRDQLRLIRNELAGAL